MRAVRDFSADCCAPAGLFTNVIYSCKLSYFNYQSNNYLIASITRSGPLCIHPHLHTIGQVIGPFTLTNSCIKWQGHP